MDARDIIRRPIITEASMAQTERKRYVFEVDVRCHGRAKHKQCCRFLIGVS